MMETCLKSHLRQIYLQAATVSALTATMFGLAMPASGEEIPEHFSPISAPGMGGATTATANDDDSAWTNPAGIGRSRKARSRNTVNAFKFPNLFIGANTNSRAFYNAVKSASGDSVEGIVSDSDDLADKPLWVRIGAFPTMLFDWNRNQPMMFGLYSNTVTKAEVSSESPAEAQTSIVSDVGGVLTYGANTDSNRLNFGLQIRPIYRYAFENVIPSEDLTNKTTMQDHVKNDSNKATGLGVDAGMLFTLADFWFPTLGVSVLNLPTGCKEDYLNPFTEERQSICGTKYSGNLGNPDALSLVDPTDFRVGIAISPRMGHDMTMRFALDLHHLYVQAGSNYYGLPGIDTAKQLHAGVEMFWGNPLDIPPISLRVGANQGYYSMGVMANFGYISLSASTYGVDTSSSPAKKEDRRTIVALSSEF